MCNKIGLGWAVTSCMYYIIMLELVPFIITPVSQFIKTCVFPSNRALSATLD